MIPLKPPIFFHRIGSLSAVPKQVCGRLYRNVGLVAKADAVETMSAVAEKTGRMDSGIVFLPLP
jgi:hypothetical protein